ncbi:MAG: YIP1 family protein [Methanolinea sp.]|nr:YIP1 family protein [Methanolinea sp.]
MKNVLDLLIRPARFFAAMEGKEPDLKVPALIAIVGGIISAITGYAMSGLYAEMFSGTAAGEGMGMFMGLMGSIPAFFGFILIWWVLMAGIFFVISRILGGSGTFSGTLAVTGYGLVPVIIGSVISALSLLSYLPRVTVPVIRNFEDPAVVQKAIGELMQDPAMREFSQVSVALSVLFLVWSANIWIFGVRHARRIGTREAAVTVLVPVGAMIVYLLVTLVGGIPFTGGS